MFLQTECVMKKYKYTYNTCGSCIYNNIIIYDDMRICIYKIDYFIQLI